MLTVHMPKRLVRPAKALPTRTSALASAADRNSYQPADSTDYNEPRHLISLLVGFAVLLILPALLLLLSLIYGLIVNNLQPMAATGWIGGLSAVTQVVCLNNLSNRLV